MNIDEISKKIVSEQSFDKTHTFIAENTSIQVRFWKKNGRYFFDTDLFPTSHFDYTEAGKEWLRKMCTNDSSIVLEQLTKRLFQISMPDDTKLGLEYIVSVWLGVLDETTSNPEYVTSILIS